jgi:hypothetical protein
MKYRITIMETDTCELHDSAMGSNLKDAMISMKNLLSMWDGCSDLEYNIRDDGSFCIEGWQYTAYLYEFLT